MARRKFTREFKVSAVQLVNQQGYSITEAARSLGVVPGNISGWMGKYGDEAPVVGERSVQAELRRLRKENARLTMERDILKKRPRILSGSRCEIRHHQKHSEAVHGGGGLPCAGGQSIGLLRLAESAGQRPSGNAPTTRVRLLTSRLVRSSGLLVRRQRQCSRGKAM